MIVPVADEDEASAYLEALNVCFPGWGGPEMFNWCFRRVAGGPPADLLAIREGGRLIAGSAIVYRRALRRDAATPEPIAMMSGSWTLPSARGRGHFTSMIQASRGLAADRGCSVLLAFAHADNASARALIGAGAAIETAAYFTHPGVPPRTGLKRALPAVDAFTTRSYPAYASRIHYQADEWRSQMLGRPRPIGTLRLSSGLVAVCETTPSLTLLLDVSTSDPRSFASSAVEIAANYPMVVAYSNDARASALLIEAGFTSDAGGVYILSTRDKPARPERWWFTNGDRM